MREINFTSSENNAGLHRTGASRIDLGQFFPDRQVLSRRGFLFASGLLFGAVAAGSQVQPAIAQETPPDSMLNINDLVSVNKIVLGRTDLSDAAVRNVPVKLHSSIFNFPKTPSSLITSGTYVDILQDNTENPNPNFVLKCIQSKVPPDYPVILWGHSGIVSGQKLPFEGIREIVEGKYVFDERLQEYVAKFVGPVQSKYGIDNALRTNRNVNFNIGSYREPLAVTGIQVLPHNKINNEAVQALFRNGNVKLATCGTSASFAVRGARSHCQRLNIMNERTIRDALKTLDAADAGGSDVYNAMTTIYGGIKSVDSEFARFFFAVYARQIEEANGQFRNLSEDELKDEPIPGYSETGINFFTAEQIYTTLYTV